MRCVLDTNIFISGIFWSGASEKILYKWFDNEFEVVISEEIIEEIVRTLMNFKIPILLDDLLLWISIISCKSVIVEPEEEIEIIRDDPDDDKFIEAAISGGAKLIISQDKHLLNVKEFRGIKIVSPDEFLRII